MPLFPRETTAFRFPAILMAGLGVILVFLLARRWLGPGPAAVAGVLALAQPHYFFHAQIAAFDAPITVMAVAVGYLLLEVAALAPLGDRRRASCSALPWGSSTTPG